MTNNSKLDLGGLIRPAQFKILPGQAEFDVSQIAFSFDGREQQLKTPYVYDLPEVKAKSTQVIEAHIRMAPDAGYLLKGQFVIQVYLTDPRNTDVEPNPCIHLFPYDIRTGFHYSPKFD